MLNLIIKDVVLMRKTILIGFAYVLGMSLAFSGTGGPAMFTASTFALVFLLLQTPCAQDDKSRADAMLNSLPIKRSMIVNARYLAVPLYVLIAIVEYLVIYGLVKLTGLPFHLAGLSIENSVGLLAVSAIFASVYYPIYFRFGYMKTRYVNIFLFCGLFAAGSAAVLAFTGNNSWQGGKAFMVVVESQPDWLVGCGILGLLLGIVLISYCLSVRFYNRREF